MRILLLALVTAACGASGGDGREGARSRAVEMTGDSAPPSVDRSSVPVHVEPEPGERRFSRLRQLTLTGENAEAYFDPSGRRLVFQARRPGSPGCDQIWTMGVNGSDLRMVSTGRGQTTCGYFLPSGDRILYSSTHAASPDCPPRPDYSQGYVWALHDHDIYTAPTAAGHPRRLTRSPGYDAEATVSPDGTRIVFTSVRDGDLEIYSMALDGSDVRRLTHEEGYDGGPFYSPDGERIVYRAHHPHGEAEREDYRRLLERGLIRPTTLEIFVMNADGSGKRQLTDNGAANFAPYFHPDGDRIIFSSNLHDPESRNFDLYMIRVDGTGLERITSHPEFDGFPMFDRDGDRLVFASNRNNRREGDTNIFIADWVDIDAP